VARVTMLALLITGVVWLLARWRPLVGLSALGLVFVLSAASVQARTLGPFDDRWSAMIRIPDVVRDVTDGGVVAYDRAYYDKEAANFYQLELADRGIRFVDSSRDRPTTDLVITAPRWPTGERWGARLVTVETGIYRQALWVMPGLLQDRLQATGDLLPHDPGEHLPDAARRQRIRVSAPSAMDAGEMTTLDVRVTHRGQALGLRPGFVRLVARWDDGSAQSADLDRALLPGESTTVKLLLVAPRRPGRHHVTIGLEQFEDRPFTPRPSFTVVVG